MIFVTHEQLIAAVHDNARAIEENAHRVLRLEKRQDDLDRLVTSVAQLATKQDRIVGYLLVRIGIG